MTKENFAIINWKKLFVFALNCAILAFLDIAKSLASPMMNIPQDPYGQYTSGQYAPGQFPPGQGYPGMRHYPPGLRHPPTPTQPGTKPAGKATTPAAAKSTDANVELQKSRPLVAISGAWQTWTDVISIDPALDKFPLTFSMENGANSTPKYKDLRVLINQKPFLTMKDFSGSATLSRSLTGVVGVGNSVISVQGYGPTGATLIWQVKTKKLAITAVTPNSFGLTDKVTIEGENLPSSATNIKVYIAKKFVQVVNGPKNQLQLKLPADLPGGKQDLIAVVGPLQSEPFKVTIKAAPHVYSVNFVSTAPGQPVTISGKGFSTTASENTVTFGGANATVSSATDTSITCTVPLSLDAANPQWYVPIIVTTNGMPSTEKVTINLSQRVIPNDGAPEQ
jgi:hypothetical protein